MLLQKLPTNTKCSSKQGRILDIAKRVHHGTSTEIMRLKKDMTKLIDDLAKRIDRIAKK